MKIERSSLDQVKQRFETLKKKKEEEKKTYDFQLKVSELEEEVSLIFERISITLIGISSSSIHRKKSRKSIAVSVVQRRNRSRRKMRKGPRMNLRQTPI